MVNFITSNNVIEMNGDTYAFGSDFPQGLSREIPVLNTHPAGVYWKVPQQNDGGIFIGYANTQVLAASPSTRPTPDSQKILLLKNDDGNYWGIAILDTDETISGSPTSRWAFNANGTGGTLPVMDTLTVPTPILQASYTNQATNGDRTFLFTFPPNPLGLLYSILASFFNGIPPVQAFQPSGITTLAQFVTWANTSGKWDMYGVWSSPNTTTLKLLSSTGSTIYVNMAGLVYPALAEVVHTLDMTVVATPAMVDGVSFGSATVPIPFLSGPFLVTDTDVSEKALINEIAKIYATNQASAVIRGGTGTNIDITTELGVCRIFNGATVVITSS